MCVDMTQIIEDIIALEWDLVNQVDTSTEKEPCLYDKTIFTSNRKNLLAAWSQELQESYYKDLFTAQIEGRNPISEKYRYMLEQTNPEEYRKIKENQPEQSMEKLFLMDWISENLLEWQESLAQKYPRLVGNKKMIRRNLENRAQKTFETYMRGDLVTFSVKTLRVYAAYIEHLKKHGLNLNQMIFQNAVAQYGCQTLEEAEQLLKRHHQ